MSTASTKKDQIQKLVLSAIGFVALLYCYFSFFLGPLNRSRETALKSITDTQAKIDSSKSEMKKASNLERQAAEATARYAILQSMTPEGAPIAWFPPRIKAHFASQQIDKASARMEQTGPYKEPELADWRRFSWIIDLPQSDFASLGKAVAALENSEPLLAVTKLQIRAVPEDPQYQQVSLTAVTTLLKK
jgi:hypothetical protein